MVKPIVEFVYDLETGDRKIHVDGVKGSGCEKILDNLEEITGPLGKRDETDDYFKPPQVETQAEREVQRGNSNA